VFLANLGSATAFVFPRTRRQDRHTVGSTELIGLLVRGPICVFAIAIVAAVGSFGYSNRLTAPAGSGMSLDTLSSVVSAALGLLAVTTNVAVAYLFTFERERTDQA
jgi:hypothetical protein